MPLDQINGSNFNQLEVAWRFKTDSLGPFPEYKLEGTPLMVKGTIYTTGGTRRSVIALDAKTGELQWVYSLREGKRAGVAPRQLSGRGVSYWTDGKGDDRVVFVTTGYRLVELNAKTGQPVQSFGRNGILDLKEGVQVGNNQQIDLETGEIGVHSTPTIVRDIVLIGSSFREGATVPTHNNTKGLVRGFDVRTGKRLWTFNTIPRPGEFGNDTLGREFVGVQRQRRRMDPDQRRRRSRTRVSADRNTTLGLLRRPSARQQSVLGEHRRRRHQDRSAQVALPAGAPSALELRQLLRVAAGRHHRRRQTDQGARAAEQDRLAVRVRPDHGSARVAD